MIQKPAPSLAKPVPVDTRLAAALQFAEKPASQAPSAIVAPAPLPDHSKAAKRAFFAPEGHRRLTINLPEDLHKKLKLTAIGRDMTATELIVDLLTKELEKA